MELARALLYQRHRRPVTLAATLFLPTTSASLLFCLYKTEEKTYKAISSRLAAADASCHDVLFFSPFLARLIERLVLAHPEHVIKDDLVYVFPSSFCFSS